MEVLKGCFDFVGIFAPKAFVSSYEGPDWLRLALFVESPANLSEKEDNISRCFVKYFQGEPRDLTPTSCRLFIVPSSNYSSGVACLSFPSLSPLMRYSELRYWTEYTIQKRELILSANFSHADENVTSNVNSEIEAQNERCHALLSQLNETGRADGKNCLRPNSLFGVPVAGFLCQVFPLDVQTRFVVPSANCVSTAEFLGHRQQIKWEDRQIDTASRILAVVEALEFQFQALHTVALNLPFGAAPLLLPKPEICAVFFGLTKGQSDLFGLIDDYVIKHPDEERQVIFCIGTSLFLYLRGFVELSNAPMDLHRERLLRGSAVLSDSSASALAARIASAKRSVATQPDATAPPLQTSAAVRDVMMRHLRYSFADSKSFQPTPIMFARMAQFFQPFFETYQQPASAEKNMSMLAVFYLGKVESIVRQVIDPDMIHGRVAIAGKASTTLAAAQAEFGIFVQHIHPNKMRPQLDWKDNRTAVWAAVNSVLPISTYAMALPDRVTKAYNIDNAAVHWLYHPFVHSRCFLGAFSLSEVAAESAGRGVPWVIWHLKVLGVNSVTSAGPIKSILLRPAVRSNDPRWFSGSHLRDLLRMWKQSRIVVVPYDLSSWIDWLLDNLELVFRFITDRVDETGGQAEQLSVLRGLLGQVYENIDQDWGEQHVRIIPSDVLSVLVESARLANAAAEKKSIQLCLCNIPFAALVGYSSKCCIAVSSAKTWNDLKDTAVRDFSLTVPVHSTRNATQYLDALAAKKEKENDNGNHDEDDDDMMDVDVEYEEERAAIRTLSDVAAELEKRLVLNAAHFREPRRWNVSADYLRVYVFDTMAELFDASSISHANVLIEQSLHHVLAMPLTVGVMATPIYGSGSSLLYKAWLHINQHLFSADAHALHEKHSLAATSTVQVKQRSPLPHVVEPAVLLEDVFNTARIAASEDCGLTIQYSEQIKSLIHRLPLRFRHLLLNLPDAVSPQTQSKQQPFIRILKTIVDGEKAPKKSRIVWDDQERIVYYLHSALHYSRLLSAGPVQPTPSQPALSAGAAVDLQRLFTSSVYPALKRFGCANKDALCAKLKEAHLTWVNKHIYVIDFTQIVEYEARLDACHLLASWINDLSLQHATVELNQKKLLLAENVEVWLVSNGLSASTLQKQTNETEDDVTLSNPSSARHIINQMLSFM